MMRRILFLGRGEIGKKCFFVLRSAENLDVKAVVSDFDLRFESFFVYPLFSISNENRSEDKILDMIRECEIDTLISVQHVWILSSSIIQAVEGFAFNLHNAKLPDYGGFNTVTHAILNGDDVYTTTIHWMTPKVDIGDIVCERHVMIRGEDTASSLYQKTIPMAVANFEEFIDLLSKGKHIPRTPVVGGGMFYKREEIHALKEIKNVNDFVEVDRKARAFYFPPHEPAYFKVGGIKYYVEREGSK